MTKRERRTFTPEEKIKILREHLEKRRPVSEICEQYGIDPSHFSLWKKTLFEGGAEVFNSKGKGSQGEFVSGKKVLAMEAKLTEMRLVVSEIAAENIELKKRTGGL